MNAADKSPVRRVLYVDYPKSIGQLLSEVAKTNSDRDALVHTEIGKRYSYESLSQELDRAARGFLSRGIKPGDKIVLWSPNIPQWLFAMLGLAKIGAVIVPVDPATTKDNLYYILEQSESRGLIVADSDDTGNMAKTAAGVRRDLPFLEHIFIISDSSAGDLISWNELIQLIRLIS